MDEKAASLLAGDAPDLLARVHAALAALTNGPPRRPSRRCGRWLKRAASSSARWRSRLRAALTGRATSPGIFDVLVLLGREESLARIADRHDGKDD